MSSKRRGVAELERAAARYGSIHERWRAIDAGHAPNADAQQDLRSGGAEPARKRESFPPPSQPAFRPAFDTLIGVPRNSFAPADVSSAPPASTDAVATPLELEAPPRRSFRRLLFAAVALGALGAAAVGLGAVERPEALLERLDAGAEQLLARLHASFSPDTEGTAQSVESLRENPPANGSDPELTKAPAAGAEPAEAENAEPPRSLGAVSETSTIAAASQQAASDAPISSRVNDRTEPDPTVPRSNTSMRSATASSAAGANQTPHKRTSGAKNAPEKSPEKSAKSSAEQALPRVMASASKSDGSKGDGSKGDGAVKDPRRSKPRAAARKASRKTGQDGIIRHSPF